MPVLTRSQMSNKAQNEANPDQIIKPRLDEEDARANLSLRNPHHGLKEKLKALTLFYEQHKRASTAFKNSAFQSEDQRFTTRPSFQLLGSSCVKESKPEEVKFTTHPSTDLQSGSFQNEEKESKPANLMKENTIPDSNLTRAYVLPQPPIEDAKQNWVMAGDRIVGFSCPRKGNVSTAVARKLSMGPSLETLEVKGIGGTLNLREAEKTEKVFKGGNRILVFVRLRPMAKKEKEAGSRCCVRITDRRDVYLTEFANENDYLGLKRLRGRHFTFDAAFPDSTSQQEVYYTTTAELVEAVSQGRNGSVFCYGATGAGKTYTMLGTVENPGVMVLAIKDLFAKVRQRSCDGSHVVHLSYLEVYNETVRDLLSPGRPLVLREDKQGIVAAGLTQYRAYSTEEVMALLQQGNRNRTTEPTRANETSSRSHAILQVMIEYRIRDAATNIINCVGKLSLIDLAGSERALATDQRTLRSLEGANINRSLLALSSCINALVEGKKHIPYRNSKLTQLLKDSLGGSCNTVMIANISPSNLSFGETQNTLHWADRAKEIRIKRCDIDEDLLPVPESETDHAKLLYELQKENRELRVQFASQQQKLLTLEAKCVAANTSPTPPSVTSLLTPPTSVKPLEKRKPMPSFLAGTCFTPESKRKDAGEAVRLLQRTVKDLEGEIEKMKKDHAQQLKQKENIIRQLSAKIEKQSGVEGGGTKRIVTRASLRLKESKTGELKSPVHRFQSPVPTAKKRSIWDIATVNSPSIATLNGRKIRSHVVAEPAAAPPSMLLQPGFTRQKPKRLK